MADITLTPTTGEPGITVTVNGTGFTKGQKVRLQVNGAGYSQNIYRANAHGEFSVGIDTLAAGYGVGTYKVDIIPANTLTPILATASFTLEVVVVKPSAPQNLTATPGNQQVTLTWTAPLDDGGAPILGYNVFQNGVFLLSVTGLQYTRTGLTNGTTYAFKVSAFNSAGGGTHSAEVTATPAGNWNLVFSDDFSDRTIARGQFAVGGTDVGYYRILPDGTKQWRNAGVRTADGRYMCMGNLAGSLWADTSRQGYYSDWKTLAVQNGVLDQEFYVDANGKGRTATISPLPLGSTLRGGITGGRVLVRLRADRVVGFKAVPLLWPDDAYDNNMEELGEIDWPEASLDKTPKAYMHYTNASSSSDQAIFTAPAGTTFQEWHDYVIEWKAGVSVEFFIDGQSIGKVTQRIPNTPMHYNLQIETSTDGERPVAGSRGKVLIDKVEVWEQV